MTGKPTPPAKLSTKTFVNRQPGPEHQRAAPDDPIYQQGWMLALRGRLLRSG
jgi:hypothetical protein